MSYRHLLSLSLLCTAVVTTGAWRGGCVPDFCPDLNVACPDLECAQGFKVDKEGCAICECVGDVKQPLDCYDDEDCDEGFYCELPAQSWLVAQSVPLAPGECRPIERPEGCYDDRDCDEGFFCDFTSFMDGDQSLVSCAMIGECLPIEQQRPCAELDEWSCITDQRCTPIYETFMVDCCPDCDCEMPEDYFVECVEATPELECSSDADCPRGMVCAIDEYADQGDGQDARPAPMGVCIERPEPECYSDADCAEGERCELYDATSGADERFARSGVCVPVEQPECDDDGDCAEGFHCMFWFDGGGTVDSDGDGATDALYVESGVCVPDEISGPCAELDERACIEAEGCEARYELVDWACACAEDEDCDCAPVYEERIFVECVGVRDPLSCQVDADCPEDFFCDAFEAPAPGNQDWMIVGTCQPVVEPPQDCLEDRDCPDGFRCVYFDSDGARPDEDALWVELGTCVALNEPTPCNELRETECADSPMCEPIYATELYDCGEDEDCIGVEERVFVECAEVRQGE